MDYFGAFTVTRTSSVALFPLEFVTVTRKVSVAGAFGVDTCGRDFDLSSMTAGGPPTCCH